MKKKSLKENLTITLEAKKYVSYASFAYGISPFHKCVISSTAEEGVEVTVRAVSALFLSNEEKIVLPFESEVELPSFPLNPAYLASVSEEKKEEIVVTVEKGGEIVLTAKTTISVLPYDTFNPTELECLCGSIRKEQGEVRKLLEGALSVLKEWKVGAEFSGYDGDKNTTLKEFASLYASFKKSGFVLKEGEYSSPFSLSFDGERTGLDLALLMAGCLEKIGLHPVVLVGKKVAVGVWLYDGCFSSAVMDDLSVIENYTARGIHNLCFVRGEDLVGENDSFTRATERFSETLKEGAYEYVLDVRRARLGGYYALPTRLERDGEIELVETKELSVDAMPSEISTLKLAPQKKLPKNKQWERRLLDLSFKNPLLNFNAKKNAVEIGVHSLDEFYEVIAGKECVKLFSASEEDRRVIGDRKLKKDFLSALLKEGELKTVLSEEELNETATRIIRKGKEADEESGGNLIYLAIGFLNYAVQGKKYSAPLLLLPVRIKKAKGSRYYSLDLRDELGVNTTLFEYLKEVFGIDVRGLDGSLEALRIGEILAMIRMEISSQKGWTVEESVFLSVFSFTRYFLWNDVRKNIDLFRETPVVSALLKNEKLSVVEGKTKKREEYSPLEVLSPLPMDESQFEAVALSKTGTSFVLHGPPGTGKSQTITNIIANALRDKKRVLFVAEKEAALSVVQRRLTSIGVGEFCLELHSTKTDKGAIVKKIEDTLALECGTVDFETIGAKYSTTENEIRRVYDSLHRPRRIGVSVYDGIVKLLENKAAPDLLGIDSAFYDSLTKEKIERYEKLLKEASFSALECGGVGSSPFEGVDLTAYSTSVRDEAYCVSKCILSEIRHLKEYLALFTAQYRQTVSIVTPEKLEKIGQIASILLKEMPALPEDEEAFKAYFHANQELSILRPQYEARFKKFVPLKEEPKDGTSWAEKTALFKLGLSAKEKWDKTDSLEVLKLIWKMQELEKVASTYSYDFEVFSRLHALSEECFLDYQPDVFNSMLIRTKDGSTKSVLYGLLHAVEGFRDGLKTFLSALSFDESKVRSDDLFRYYTEKANGILTNIDKLGSWCNYKKIAFNLREEGLGFMVDGMESGKVDPYSIVSCFEKHVYRNFLDTFFTSDELLSAFSGASLDEKIARLKRLSDDVQVGGKEYLRNRLVSALPKNEEGPVSLELMNFRRFSSTRGMSLKKLFTDFPELMRRTIPCMLMSPTTVAQYLSPEVDFDLVIFDEASQLPTAEAIGSLARAKSAIIVGDPNQLPPTSFFSSGYVDEENLENEDLESVLDDALAIGMPQRYLTWHYRSKHESLIAFSNNAYYQGRLSTFPSPDAMESKVTFRFVENGVYDRGFTKRNKEEAIALVDEVIRRLSDPVLSGKSIGVVTFSSVQKEYIERILTKAIFEKGLETVAYDREEPIFVKNLENVQGDERDVILFSVCYGPDRTGRISLNFGPLNQTGGWRRLNVAVSRAKEEMVIFASMRAALIDLSKTTSKGVAGLKGFLEFAERGKLTTNAMKSGEKRTLGKFLSADLASYGYESRCDVGTSSFKIDVAVVDPAHPERFILAILGDENGAVYDRTILEPQALRLADWNVVRVYSASYFSNPQKEVKRIREILDKLTGAGNRRVNILKQRVSYQKAELNFPKQSEEFIVNAENDKELLIVMKKIIGEEQPVSQEVVVTRTLNAYGIASTKAERKLKKLLSESDLRREKILEQFYYYGNEKVLSSNKYRVTEQGEPILTPYDVFALTRSLLENRIALDKKELVRMLIEEFRLPSKKGTTDFLEKCLKEGVKRKLFMETVAGRMMLL